jgi:hypothetical protein
MIAKAAGLLMGGEHRFHGPAQLDIVAASRIQVCLTHRDFLEGVQEDVVNSGVPFVHDPRPPLAADSTCQLAIGNALPAALITWAHQQSDPA